MSDYTTVITPVGRWIRGDIWKAKDKDFETGQAIPENERYFAFWIGVEKTNPDFNKFFGELQAIAQASFASIPADFSWKLVDGDRPDVDLPEAKGCHCIRVSGKFAPQVVKNGGAILLTDPKSVKKGDYIRAVMLVKGNANTKKPGLYLNPSVVEWIGYGDPITSGAGPVDAKAVLGAAGTAYIPAGAKTTPSAGTATPGAVTPTPDYGGLGYAAAAQTPAPGYTAAAQTTVATSNNPYGN